MQEFVSALTDIPEAARTALAQLTPATYVGNAAEQVVAKCRPHCCCLAHACITKDVPDASFVSSAIPTLLASCHHYGELLLLLTNRHGHCHSNCSSWPAGNDDISMDFEATGRWPAIYLGVDDLGMSRIIEVLTHKRVVYRQHNAKARTQGSNAGERPIWSHVQAAQRAACAACISHTTTTAKQQASSSKSEHPATPRQDPTAAAGQRPKRASYGTKLHAPPVASSQGVRPFGSYAKAGNKSITGTVVPQIYHRHSGPITRKHTG